MKIYYVSHPYGGKQKNEVKADVIVQALQTEYPDICFVSPVHAIRCPYSKTDYIQGLDYCLELLRRCDGIVMCGKWQESIGCVSEFILAREICKDVKTADKMLVGTGWNEALAYARGEDDADGERIGGVGSTTK